MKQTDPKQPACRIASALFTRYADAIRHYDGDPLSPSLHIASDGPLSVFYAPFDVVNPEARVVLLGITPGKSQANRALIEARAQLQRGASPFAAIRAAKSTGAFAAGMRKNLVAMLDHIGLAQRLELPSCAELFDKSAHLLQTASALPFPVFHQGENYNGNPDLTRSPFLRTMVLEHFVPLLAALPNAIYVPLGPVPGKLLQWLSLEGRLTASQILAGLPHPSGANAERIAYFLGAKPRHALSAKTDPDKLDQALAQLRNRVIQIDSGQLKNLLR